MHPENADIFNKSTIAILKKIWLETVLVVLEKGDLKLLIDFHNLNIDLYDVIVAGSGPAGATVAKGCAAHGKKVLVLETGTSEYNDQIQSAYSTMEGFGHYDSGHWPSHWLRALGGTSAVWAGWTMPLSARNFLGWPIDRLELEPWYEYAAKELSRPISTLNWDGGPFLDFSWRAFSTQEPRRYGESENSDPWNNRQIHVLTGATLSKLVPEKFRRAVETIVVYFELGKKEKFALKSHQKIVLAAGGMGNAQVLLASSSDGNKSVGNEEDQVGRYLMEHPHAYGCAEIMLKSSFSPPEAPENLGPYALALVPDNDLFETLGGLDISLQLQELSKTEKTDLHRFLEHRLNHSARFYSATTRSEMEACPDNRVEITGAIDRAGLPKLRATCILGHKDWQVIIKALSHLGHNLAKKNLGRLRINNKTLFNISGGGHTMGTTRMGDDAKTSVVDRNCRVHGYNNLYIAGSSLFTHGGFANPTMTIVALAARLGNHLGRPHAVQ